MSGSSPAQTDTGKGAEEEEEVQQTHSPLGGITGGEHAFSFNSGGADESVFAEHPLEEEEEEGEEKEDDGKKFVKEWGPLSRKEFEDKQGADAYKWVHIPKHIRLREPHSWSVVDICRPVPPLALAMSQFLHDSTAQDQVQDVKYGDYMSFIDLIKLTWSSFESVFLYEYRTLHEILPEDKQKLKRFFRSDAGL